MEKWFLISNPHSGGGRCERDWHKVKAILKEHDLDFEVAFTKHPNHALKLVEEAIKNGYRKFIANGGDGTYNEVVNGIFRQQIASPKEITLAMIPNGTGNDWGKTFQIPDDYSKAVQLIQREKTYTQDIGVIDYEKNGKPQKHYFINVAGTAYDGFVTLKTNELKAQGRSSKLLYLMTILRYLLKYEPTRLTYTVDGKSHTEEVFTLAVGICRYNGDGMKQAPKANPADGLLDLTVIRKMPKLALIWNLPKLKDGSFIQLDPVSTFTATEIEVSSAPQVLLEADGESLGETPAKFTLLPQALNVVIGQEPD